MKRKLLLILLVVLNFNLVIAQVTDGEKTLRNANTTTDDGWKTGGVLSINLAQASFVNWAAGGQNSLGINGLFSAFATYHKGKSSWDNMLDVGYGILKQGKNSSFIKTDDKIDFSSKYGRQASKSWYYAAILNFKTQMTNGYNYPNDSVAISKLMAPAYLIGAIGMDFKPCADFTAFIAPFTSKTTFVLDEDFANAGAFGVTPAIYTDGLLTTPGKKVRSEFGGYIRVVYTHSFFKEKNVTVLSKLDLFSNYLHNPQNIDVNWENIFSFKVNKFISATITTQLMYDDDIIIAVDRNDDGVINATDGPGGPRLQFKEILGIGFTYKF
ncbi:MAG: DUF3078 domain-containing protein [Bacteroidales bacterium]|nr:DUF3078 domain-containing protein [Bacteroidales bacterium]HOY39550.1 DUF3078 domain-containing protein [Bacteroidales bacterium]